MKSLSATFPTFITNSVVTVGKALDMLTISTIKG